jgi:hypothetical protein
LEKYKTFDCRIKRNLIKWEAGEVAIKGISELVFIPYDTDTNNQFFSLVGLRSFKHRKYENIVELDLNGKVIELHMSKHADLCDDFMEALQNTD